MLTKGKYWFYSLPRGVLELCTNFHLLIIKSHPLLRITEEWGTIFSRRVQSSILLIYLIFTSQANVLLITCANTNFQSVGWRSKLAVENNVRLVISFVRLLTMCIPHIYSRIYDLCYSLTNFLVIHVLPSPPPTYFLPLYDLSQIEDYPKSSTLNCL